MGYEREMSARQKALELNKSKEAMEAEIETIVSALTVRNFGRHFKLHSGSIVVAWTDENAFLIRLILCSLHATSFTYLLLITGKRRTWNERKSGRCGGLPASRH